MQLGFRISVGMVLGQQAELVWHKDTSLGGADVVILPGGFAYGDYLRTGAIARFSPIMDAVTRFANAGVPVLGICNGFQVLLESGLLPGAMLRNTSLHFRCEHVHVRVEQTGTPFTLDCASSQVLRIPIAHGEGNYAADEDTVARLEGDGRVAFRYCGPEGDPARGTSPNGSRNHIAGIYSERLNVLGMMPHPENAVEALAGGEGGRGLFESLMG